SQVDRVPLPTTRGPVRSTIAPSEGEARLVVLAVPADGRWSATLNGRRLVSRGAGGRQAFEVGTQGGHLDVSYGDAAYRWWWWAGALVLLWSELAALPLHDRRFREAIA